MTKIKEIFTIFFGVLILSLVSFMIMAYVLSFILWQPIDENNILYLSIRLALITSLMLTPILYLNSKDNN